MNQKQEAIRRMNELGLHDLVPDFEKGVVYQSVRLNRILNAVLQKPDDETSKLIHDFEAKHDCVVYHAQKTNTEVGELLSLLFVSNEEDLWESELEKEDDTFYTFSYVYNLAEPSFSEFGDIGIVPSMGGVTRVC